MKALMIMMAAAALSSCMSFSDRPLRPMKNAILAQNPELILEKEVAINVGKGLFSVLDAFAVGDSDFSELDNVNVAIYNVSAAGAGDKKGSSFSTESFARALQKTNKSLHWEQIVRVRDDGENLWVFAGMDLRRSELKAISVIVLEQDELVLISVDGDINEMMIYALESSHGHRVDQPAG
ncbi:MAG: DUF4252 domain-containing protein [Pseudohongiellaceae bacterium]